MVERIWHTKRSMPWILKDRRGVGGDPAEADQGDTTTVIETLGQAGENGAELMGTEEANQKPQMHLPGIEEVVTDKGYHSGRDAGDAEKRGSADLHSGKENRRGNGIGTAKASNKRRSMRTGGE